jgi:glycosyltransferase involved in cell wall biosynthesis
MFVPDEAGIKVPVTTPAETVQALAEGMRRMEANRDLLSAMGQASWASARLQTWESRAQQMTNLYQEITCADRNL